MISALTKLPNNNLEITITIPWQKVKNGYDLTLKKISLKTEIKGFRQGKAPEKLIENKVGKTAIYEQMIKTLIPQVYLEAIKEHHLKPIVNPQIQIVSAQEDKDWQIKALICELPTVNLGDYTNEIKKALVKAPSQSRENKINKVYETLLKTCQVDLPELLVTQEVEHMLSRLIDQTGQLGLSIEQYLNSKGKTKDELRQEYKQQAEKTLKLEIILATIANQEKIKISEAEIDKMIQAIPDEKTRKSLNTPQQRAYIQQILQKSQVLDKLSLL